MILPRAAAVDAPTSLKIGLAAARAVETRKTSHAHSAISRESGALLRLVVRNAGDIMRLRTASKFVPRLPRSGIRVLVDALPASAAADLENSAKHYIRACGCSEGAAVALITLCAAIAYRIIQVGARGLRASDLMFGCAALAVAGFGSMAAKHVAIRLARHRFEKQCEAAIALLSGASVR